MKFELHCHSFYSKGKKIPVEATDSPADLMRAAKAIGLDGLALTDHSTDRGWKEASQEAKRLGLLFIPAIELFSLEGDIIGLGLDERIKSGLSVEETVDRIHEQGGVAVAAHPFDVRRIGIGRSSAKADAIEAFNSLNVDRFSNRIATSFAGKMHKPAVAGSDAHTKEMLGQCVNHIDCHDMDSCLKQIRKGNISFEASYIPLEKLLPWVKRRFALSYPEVIAYIEKNYWQPKRWLSERLANKFVHDRNERLWYWTGELGLAGAKAYGLARSVF